MRNFCLFLLVSSIAFTLNAQKIEQNKAALIVQNTKFDNSDWEKPDQNFASIANSGATVKNLIIRKGFPPNNIWLCKNLSASQYRDTVKAFNKKLALLRKKHGSLVVVQYLLSHGTNLPDKSGEERKADPSGRDILDEVFVCTDTPNQIELSKDHQLTKVNTDYHPQAIVDDELGIINDKIVEAIGPEGHYLLLSDFCNSERGAKGPNGEFVEELNQMTDGGDFLDFSFKPSSPQKPVFVMLSASNSSINIASDVSSKCSYFVQALVKAFEDTWFFVPTYRDFHRDFKTALMALDAMMRKNNENTDRKGIGVFNKGGKVPNIYPEQGEDADKPLFNESTLDKTMSLFESWLIPKTAHSKDGSNEDTKRFTFYKPDSLIFFPYGYVTISKSEGNTKQVVGTGLIDKVTEKELGVLLPMAAKVTDKINYLITPNKVPLERAYAALQDVNNKMDLRKVLRELHSPLLKVNTRVSINAYKSIDKVTVQISKDSTTLKNLNYKVDTTDNITIAVTLHNKDLYYTILDVTASKGIRAGYRPVSFYNQHFGKKVKIDSMTIKEQANHFRSRFTDPFKETSHLWVLVSDTPFDEEDLKTYLFDDEKSSIKNQIKDAQHRRNLWSILKHIRYFEEISYTVSPTRK